MNKKKEYTIEIEGGRVTGTIPRLSSFFGVDYETVKQRIRCGWTVEQALELTDAPPHKVVTASQEQVDLILKLPEKKKPVRKRQSTMYFYHATSHSGYYTRREKP